MEIQSLCAAHLPQMAGLLRANYDDEKRWLPTLPEVPLPDLREIAENGLGVAAVEKNRLLGYWGASWPFPHAFGTAATGVFTELHAHGAVTENRAEIYRRMYQEAARRWVEKGITYHGISLFAHDDAASAGLFDYGFGRRCSDAICPLEKKPIPEGPFSERRAGERADLYPLQRARHLAMSPCFMPPKTPGLEAWLEEESDQRFFAASEDGRPIAFLAVGTGGETFVADHEKMLNLHGAYCLPEYRGRGIMDGLLDYVRATLATEGCQYLGVDCETMNPNALHYWPKHFRVYTYSLTRRVDEGILGAAHES